MKRGILAIAAALALTGCEDLLDVENPNNLVEESIRQRTAATAVVNGALALTHEAASSIWQPYLIASDELAWIGSRDAWQTLDFGFVADFNNEFTDAAFPDLGAARWMSDEAIEILDQHVVDFPDDAEMKHQQARAYFVAGMIYTIIGEVQEDFAFSDKKEAAPPVGPTRMHEVLDKAVQYLDKAATLAAAAARTDLETRAIAVRARARHSRAMWDKLKPTPNTADPLVASAAAAQDAQAVLSRVTGDWTYKFTYSASTVTNDMAAWVNARAENQFGAGLVEVDPTAVKKITAIRLRDPIDDVPDPVIGARVAEWKGGDFKKDGDSYPPLTFVSARMMRLILAEDALARGDEAGFATQINEVRALDGLTPYSGQIPARDMLTHARRGNLFLMGLRLADMYRFGIRDPLWQPNSDAFSRPGTLLPITIIERRANPHLQGEG